MSECAVHKLQRARKNSNAGFAMFQRLRRWKITKPALDNTCSCPQSSRGMVVYGRGPWLLSHKSSFITFLVPTAWTHRILNDSVCLHLLLHWLKQIRCNRKTHVAGSMFLPMLLDHADNTIFSEYVIILFD